MAEQAVVSIIIPVYNTGAYLRACLDSVAAQTFTAWEAICVDDGSTDGSAAILREYADRDARFRIIQQDNRGAGISRNTGMQAACGKYLYFIDADDFLMPDTLKVAVTACEKEQAQIALFSYCKVNADDGSVIKCFRLRAEYSGHPLLRDCVCFRPEDAGAHLLQMTTPAPWNKLFDRAFIMQADIHFEDRPNSNDLFFTQTAMMLAEKIVITDLPLYNYRVNVKNSLQSKKHSDPCQFIEARLAVRADLIKRGLLPRYEKAWQADFLTGCVFTLKTTRSRAVLRQIHQRLLRQDIAETGALSRKLPPIVENFIKGPDIFASSESRAIKTLHSRSASGVPAVSVIVPVCGTVPGTQDSLKRLLAQTLPSAEIICVCDGAGEQSLEEILALAEADGRITVITENRSGLSAARNTGLRYATGKYVYFYDIGTQLEATATEALYRRAEEADTDILFFEADRPAKDARRYVRTEESVKNGRDFFLQAFEAGEYTPSVCLQFLNRSFLAENGISFEEGILRADEAFTYRALLCARAVSVLKGVLLRGRAAFSEADGTSDLLQTLSFLTVYCDCIREAERCEPEPEVKAAFGKQAESIRAQLLRSYKKLSADSRALAKAYCDAEQCTVLREADLYIRRNQNVPAMYWNHFLQFLGENGFRVTVNRGIMVIFSGIKGIFRIK